MTFDFEVCAAYIQLGPKIETVADSWPLDGPVARLDVIVDLDAERNVLGVEMLGPIGDGPEHILTAIATELNQRPRKTLGGITPAAALEKLLLNPPKPSVATTL